MSGLTGPCQWEDRFLELDREWRDIRRQAAASDMTRWEIRFAAMSHEYQRLVAGGMWVSGPADFLGIIGREQDERTHARVLAWLLTPTGRHGLGNRLLMRLLEHYDSKRPAVGNQENHRELQDAGHLYNVECSYWRHGREADIFVWDEAFSLVIEMKINAAEGTRQLTDLYHNFNARGGRFLFLTRDGSEPTTATADAKRAFATVSWSQVGRMIDAALTDSPAAKRGGAAMVENYVMTLKERFE